MSVNVHGRKPHLNELLEALARFPEWQKDKKKRRTLADWALQMSGLSEEDFGRELEARTSAREVYLDLSGRVCVKYLRAFWTRTKVEAHMRDNPVAQTTALSVVARSLPITANSEKDAEYVPAGHIVIPALTVDDMKASHGNDSWTWFRPLDAEIA